MQRKIGRVSRVSVRSISLSLAAFAAILALADRPAWAQLSAKQLLAPAVNDFGPQYQDVEKAVEAFRRGNGDEARRLLETARKKSPHLAPADVMLAQLMFSAGQIPATRALLEKTVVDLPEDPESFIIIGDLALREGRVTEAEAMFVKGRDLCAAYNANPKRKASMLNNAAAGMAAVAEARRDWDEAVARLKAWIALDEKNAGAHQRLGQAQFRLKKYDDAIASFTTAHQLDGALARPEVSMGLLVEQAGQHETAVKWMKTAVEKGADDVDTLLAAGGWALDTGDVAQARKLADAALKLEPNSLPAKMLSGLAARHQGDVAAATKAFEEMLELSPNNVLANNQLAMLLVDSKSHREQIRALGYAHLNVEINNDVKKQAGRESAVALIWVLHNLGRDDTLVQRLPQVLSAGGVSSETAYLAARIYADLGEKPAAREILTRALAQPSSFPGRDEAEKLLSQLRAETTEATANNTTP